MMDFSYFLSAYMPDGSYGGKKVYEDMVAQAVLAEKLGYRGVAIPEHHLINILMIPSPLQLAVKIAALTRRIDLITSVVVLPIRDMRVLAGELIQAAMLCDDRLIVGLGRGAFPYELGRLGTSLAESKEKFDESLAVLEALLSREEVSWSGKYYNFESITVMPRPHRPMPFVIAAVTPEGIFHAASQGYSVQTTPLSGSHDVLLKQVDAFNSGKAAAGTKGHNLRFSLQRGTYLARSPSDAKEKVALAYEYYKRFENVKGPGVLKGGLLEPLPRKQTMEALAENLLICTAAEMIDRLSVYSELGIDEVLVPSGYGQAAGETLDMMHRFSEEVMPHFRSPSRAYG
jgi:flavin-dependent trigonelline monooxygenase, oxygenase component